jgi:hypothetical protein
MPSGISSDAVAHGVRYLMTCRTVQSVYHYFRSWKQNGT